VRTTLIQALLAAAVLAIWLGSAGWARLNGPLERLHCVAFINIAAGAFVLAAAGLSGGPADDVIKVALLFGALLTGGAAVAHASARAILRRRAPP
jgi:multicomponent Na+:H+ antiporter subunit G